MKIYDLAPWHGWHGRSEASFKQLRNLSAHTRRHKWWPHAAQSSRRGPIGYSAASVWLDEESHTARSFSVEGHDLWEIRCIARGYRGRP